MHAFLVIATVLAASQPQRISFHRVPAETLESRLRQALTEMPVPGQKLPNLVCDLPGAEPGMILVTAHHDLAQVGEGAADNWSGSVLLPALYESLAKAPRKWTYRFVAFAGEETGLHGSTHYVRLMKKKQAPRPLAQINVDTIGLGMTEYCNGRAQPQLANLLLLAAKQLKLPVGILSADQVSTDDTEPFHDAKVPTLSITSITAENWKLLHTPRDTISLVSTSHYDDSYRTIALLLAILDATKAEALAARN
jgi:Zn-dependent M28 family amino/carboxypeptidase